MEHSPQDGGADRGEPETDSARPPSMDSAPRTALFPINVNLAGRRCIVAGGGRVAERKVRGLLEASGDVTVVAPSVTPWLETLAVAGQIRWDREEYAEACLDGAFLAVAATNVREVNAAVAAEAQARGILVNCADAPGEGSYVTPAQVRRGDLLITVTASGASPTLAAVIREQIADRFDEEWVSVALLFGRLRSRIQTVSRRETERKDAVRALLQDSQLRAMLKEGRLDDAEAHAIKCLLSWSV